MLLFTHFLQILKNRKLREYEPVSENLYSIPGYYLLHDGQKTECKVFHILYDPVMILVACKNEFTFKENELYQLLIKMESFDAGKNILLTLKFHQCISQGDSCLLLFEVLNTVLPLNLIERWYLKRIYAYSQQRRSNFIADFSYEHYKKLVALFVQPKKVYLISIKAGDSRPSFPIDLCALHNNCYYIGIRNSNKNANLLAVNDEFYISSAAFSNYEQIYNLGKFSKDKNLNENTIDLIPDTPIPDLICDYAKVKLTAKIKLDNQSVYVAEIITAKKLNTGKKPLYHVHKLWFLQHQNNKQLVSF